MQFKQASMTRGQGGFTLIELIVVIVILGILAATALPKFADLGADARQAKMQGARGAVASAASIARAQWLVDGANGGQVMLDNVPITMVGGFPTAASIQTAASLSVNDYTLTVAGTTLTVAEPDRAGCSFTYDATNGTVSVAPVRENC